MSCSLGTQRRLRRTRSIRNAWFIKDRFVDKRCRTRDLTMTVTSSVHRKQVVFVLCRCAEVAKTVTNPASPG